MSSLQITQYPRCLPPPAQGLSTPSAHKKWQKQLARAPGLLEKVREGRAALDALAAKVRKGLKVA